MSEIQVSMTKLRQNLGNWVNRAAYGGERIILVAHGEPKAAIIGVEDLRRLEQFNDNLVTQQGKHTNTLVTADLLRERIRQWQDRHGIEPEDSVETLHQLREGHDDDLLSVH